MIKSTKIRRDYKSEITDYLDKHLIKCYGCSDFYSNYIYSEPVNGYWAIRVPGATRGHIKVEDGVVKEIKLYEDTFCYGESVFDELNKFVGRKIDLEYIKGKGE